MADVKASARVDEAGSITTEQLAKLVLQSVKKMSPEEKAEVRELLEER
jgi:oligoendopeptidase F